MKYFLFGVSAYFLSLPMGIGNSIGVIAELCRALCETISAGPVTY